MERTSDGAVIVTPAGELEGQRKAAERLSR